MEDNWELYILRCKDGSLYTGIARDADKRFLQHSTGRGAKYTRGRGPLEMVYREKCADHSQALRREWEIKHLSKQEKEALITLSAPEEVYKNK